MGRFSKCEDVERRLRIAIPKCSGPCVNFTALGKFMEFHGYLDPSPDFSCLDPFSVCNVYVSQ